MSDDTEKRFSDAQARAILARAVEIDSRPPRTSVDELRAIAAEAGISETSLEAALREQATALAPRRAPASRRAATLVAASGVPLGLVAGSLLASGTAMTGLGLLGLGLAGLAASGALVVTQGATGTLRSFHLKNLALWGGVAAGSLAAVVLAGGEVARLPVLMAVGWCVRQWVTSGILGSAAVIAVRRARRPGGPDADRRAPSASEPAAGGRWAALVKRVWGWLTRPLRRDVRRAAPAAGRLSTA